MEYVRLRRLAFAAWELSSGRKLIDIALDYGFETHSGFSKAFKRRYGVSPEKYRAYVKCEKPPMPDILRMNEYSIGGVIMEPKIVTLGVIKLAGYRIKTKAENGENIKAIPEFWQAYLTDGRAMKLHGGDFVKKHAEYGACFPVNPENNEFSYVIGIEVKDGAVIPKEFYACEIPEATYAVFSTPPVLAEEFSKTIQGTWQFIYNEWFPASGYEYAPNCVDFEYYDEKNMSDAGNVCDIYIPVAKK
jgi:AraC family transcriptional regulator